jgi:folate-dependent phosphoribosylglycinamide formyltransferase PurN
MKILFCTKRDIFGVSILNWILPRLGEHQVKVLLSDKTRTEENSVQALVEEKFLERDLPLRALFPLIDQHATAGTLATFEGCRQRYQVEIDTITSINDPETEAMIRGWAPDLIVSARFSLIFKANIERIPPLGIFNIHPGALPGYAGLYAPLRGVLNKDKQLGCTLHRVDEGIDTGEVYSVSYLPFTHERSIFGHIAQLYELGLASFLELLSDLEQRKKPVLRVQDKALFRYFRLPDEAAFKNLKALGVDLVAFDVYSDFIKQFVPEALANRLSEALSAEALEQVAQQVMTGGIDKTVSEFSDQLARSVR